MNRLNITHRNALRLLINWSKNIENNDKNVNCIFDKRYPIGFGCTHRQLTENNQQLIIGIKSIKTIFPLNNQILDDETFIRIGVTLFHEIAHYDQYINPSTNKEIIISDISKYGNLTYYQHSWAELPHEIDAEYNGIMSMWDALTDIYPDKATQCMLQFLNERTKQDNYIITHPKNGFQSKKQVDNAFQSAYDNSLSQPRKPQYSFQRYDDEIVKLLVTDWLVRPEYQDHFKLLVGPISGEKKDRLMASLVLYLHPEIKNIYTQIYINQLTPESEFHLPMPENREDAQKRVLTINEAIDFARNIEILTDKQQNNLNI